MPLDTLRDLYEHELRDLKDAETQIAMLLPRMAEAVTDDELATQLRRHGEQSRRHRERLESILESAESEGEEVVCDGIRGIVRESERFLQRDDIEPSVRDAGVLSLAQRVEHYEMAGYGAVRTYARLLGDEASEGVLQTTLEEEGDTDELLTRIAERSVNEAATA